MWHSTKASYFKPDQDEEIPSFPPHKEVDFSFELLLGATPTSKAPYRMSTPKLIKLKLQLKKMFDKGYIR